MSRWVRIQTSIFDHEVFAAEPFSEREAWMWLISKAAWKDTKHRIGHNVVDVPTGSMFLTLREMQATWRWKSDKRVRSFLSMLEREEMIETKTDAGKTQVSICNYSRYQDSGRTEDATGTQPGRTADALKTPEHQYTNVSEANASSCPEPAKAAPVASSPTAIELPCASGELFPITEADVTEWRGAFPAVDIRQQLAAMRSWLNANPTRRKTRKGMRRFAVSWLDRKQNDSTAPQQRSGSPPKTQSLGQMFQDDARRMGLIDEPDSNQTGYLDASNGSAEGFGTGGARLLAFPADNRRIG